MTVNPYEILIVVDENNKVIGKEKRKIVHSKRLWHRTAHIWVLDGFGSLLCHKRSLKKDSDPGLWDPRFGGHLGPDVDYMEGAIAETKEEIGILFSREQLVPLGISKSMKDKEFQVDFEGKWRGELSMIKLETDEIAEVKWLKVFEVERAYRNRLSAWSISNVELRILQKLIQS